MDRATIEVYDRAARQYRAQRRPYRPERAVEFADAVPPGQLRLDLGCGPGLYLPLLGSPVVAADASAAMVAVARTHVPDALPLRCDLTALPFGRGTVAGVWASKAHQHVPAPALPGALAELHRVLRVGGRLDLTMFATPTAGDADVETTVSGQDDSFPGRLFTLYRPAVLADLLIGAGFSVDELAVVGDDWPRIEVTAHRTRTLADSVDGAMRLLVCGLNPSILSADVGVGFARPGNRFWPALRLAGLTARDRDVPGLLRHDHIGMTDLVKRPTVGASELTRDEYQAGHARVERLCRLLSPGAICFVGLAGWRAAVDRKAVAGWQPQQIGATPVYVMPSTSGLNARVPLADLADHLRAAAGPPPPP